MEISSWSMSLKTSVITEVDHMKICAVSWNALPLLHWILIEAVCVSKIAKICDRETVSNSVT